ncbi:Piso0_001901 [Millerozyma farinosa CBS 7064]|uniref:Piso0_001901 protein n=1 Tax=Pichia sorbitophila (strain ATCC MYA-4447 / BCRC 22081 / CBS 7064 / NBRC 10061 / NRRL Y-12695) TaxID=559304 RepID=G8YB57_PICSO|nr:Piso0_001901 [Millerozyma farinosa CBS 7064]
MSSQSTSNLKPGIDPQSSMEASNSENIDLNDDLAESDEHSTSSVLSQSNSHLHRRTGSSVSTRNSFDAENSYISSAYYQSFNNNYQEDKNVAFSPLGPNSIYELTIGSDISRRRHNRAAKSSIAINGGNTVVHNLNSPTIKEIPAIKLSKIKRSSEKPITDDLDSKELENEYMKFNSSYNALTEDMLQKLANSGVETKGQDKDARYSYAAGEDKELVDGKNENKNQLFDKIPKVFFDPNFRLDDPRTFKEVFGVLDMNNSEATTQNEINFENNQIQEKLSNYLDLVEINLINEISKSSSHFFNAMEDIHQVKSQTSSCSYKIYQIINDLKSLEETSYNKGIKIVTDLKNKHHIESLESALLQVSSIKSISELAKLSFNNNRVEKALKEVLLGESLIKGEISLPENDIDLKFSGSVVDLSGVSALRGLQNELSTIKRECASSYVDSFIKLLLEDVHKHSQNVANNETMRRIQALVKNEKSNLEKVNSSFRELSSDFKEELKSYVRNLALSGYLENAFSLYQDRIIIEVKDIIKRNLPRYNKVNGSGDLSEDLPHRSYNSPDFKAEGSGMESGITQNSLSFHIKSMQPDKFYEMLTCIYATLSESLRRFTTHQKLLLDLALISLGSLGIQDVNAISFDISGAINKAIEITQLRITKIMNVRSEQSANLSLDEYLKIFSLSRAYLQECELINPGYTSSGVGNSLNEWVSNHISYFLYRYQQSVLTELVQTCEKENWKDAAVDENFQQAQVFLDQIVNFSTYVETNGAEGFSGEAWSAKVNFTDTPSASQPESIPDISDNILSMRNEKYRIPTLVTKTIGDIRDYLIISKIFTNKKKVIRQNLLNYFKLLNSKISQAILSAGATRTAGLKHITTKHIALCIQVAEFYFSLLTILKVIFKDLTPSESQKGPSPELNFEDMINNYKDLESSLFSKLVSIMYDRTTNHCATITTINWSEPVKYPQQCHHYMETLVKETNTVSRVLSKYLPEVRCSLILSQIFDNYKKLLVNCYCNDLGEFKDVTEKQAVLKDIDYFRVKLCELPGYGNSGQAIWQSVNSRPTIEDKQMEEVMKNNIKEEKA